jgi:hypothetical protein
MTCAPPTLSASPVTTYRSRAAEVSVPPTTSVRSSSSTAAIRAPLASPPLQEGPLESVVRPHLHLHHQRPPVRAEAAVIIPRPPSASCRQPSPTVLRPHQPRKQLHPSTPLLIDQFPEHLDPATGPTPSFPHRPSTTTVVSLCPPYRHPCHCLVEDGFTSAN